MKIIMGRPHRLPEELARRAGEAIRRGKRALVLVPSQETLRTELMILDELGLEGSFQIEVLSPARLRERVFERAGRPRRTVLDERGKRMVLCGILEEERENLRVYARTAVCGPEHLAALLSELIACLKLSGQDAETALRKAQDFPEPLRGKMTELARLYARYEERLAGRLTDAEELLFEEEKRLPLSRVTEDAEVFAAGFDVVTPSLARQLVMLARETEVSLFIESDRNAAPDGSLFAPVNASLERLAEEAGKAGLSCEKIRVESGLRAAEEIAHLERNLFALGGKALEGEPRSVRLIAASSPLREAHLICSAMRRLLFSGVQSQDIAVMYPAGSPCAALLPPVAARYGLSVYLAEKRPAAGHPLVRYSLAALALAGEGTWRVPEFAECAKSGFTGLSDEEADRLVAYCESMELRGSQLTRPFVYRMDASMTDEQLLSLENSRRKVAEPILAFRKRLRGAEGRDAVLSACLDHLSAIGALPTLEAMCAELAGKGFESEAQDCLQIWNALMDTMDQLHETLPESASADLVRRLLSGGLSALSLSALPPAEGAVLCGEIGNLRPGQIRHLFLAGMNDREGSEPGGFFTADERARLEKSGVYLGFSVRERAALSSLDLLKAMSSAGERLTVSFSRSDESGRALREGEGIRALRRCFHGLRESGGTEEELRAMLAASGPAAESLCLYAQDLSKKGNEPAADFAGVAAALYATEQGKRDLTAALLQMEKKPKGRLSPAVSRALYGERGETVSATRMETFAACPFLYYTSYGLRLRQRREKAADPGTVGTLMHEAMEKFLAAAAAHPAFPALPEEVAESLCREADRDLIAAWRKSPYGESRRGEAMAERISRRIFRSARSMLRQFEEGGFRPLRGELAFGDGDVPPLVIDLPDSSAVFLRGRIDRVDLADLPGGGRAIRIVDYKSGKKKPDPVRLYCGLQLQLALYMAAALSVLPGTEPAGFCYCRLSDPKPSSDTRDPKEAECLIEAEMRPEGLFVGAPDGKKKNRVTREEMAAILRFAREKAAELALQAASGVIDALPFGDGDDMPCGNCAARAVCGFDPTLHPRRNPPAITWKEIAENGSVSVSNP